MKWFRRVRTPVSALSAPLPRTELLRRGRVAILDDETPEMLQDLLGEGLAVTHLQSTADPQFPRLTEAFYDVLLLDYGGIGGKFVKTKASMFSGIRSGSTPISETSRSQRGPSMHQRPTSSVYVTA